MPTLARALLQMPRCHAPALDAATAAPVPGITAAVSAGVMRARAGKADVGRDSGVRRTTEAADFRASRPARGRDPPISSAMQAASRARSCRATDALLPNRPPHGCCDAPSTAFAGRTSADDPAGVTPR